MCLELQICLIFLNHNDLFDEEIKIRNNLLKRRVRVLPYFSSKKIRKKTTKIKRVDSFIVEKFSLLFCIWFDGISVYFFYLINKGGSAKKKVSLEIFMNWMKWKNKENCILYRKKKSWKTRVYIWSTNFFHASTLVLLR